MKVDGFAYTIQQGIFFPLTFDFVAPTRIPQLFDFSSNFAPTSGFLKTSFNYHYLSPSVKNFSPLSPTSPHCHQLHPSVTNFSLLPLTSPRCHQLLQRCLVYYYKNTKLGPLRFYVCFQTPIMPARMPQILH